MLLFALQADDPGLGKTIQTIAAMKANPVHSTLIVTTLSNENYWAAELEYERIDHLVVDCKTSVPINAKVEKLVVLTHYSVLTNHVSHGGV